MKWLLPLLLCAQTAAAAQIDTVTVTHKDNRYQIDMRVTLDADPARAYAVFSEYSNLSLINPAVRSAKITEIRNDGTVKLATIVNVCVLFFCREMQQVQVMRKLHNGNSYGLEATVIPAESDLKYGHAQWTMTPCEQSTCLHFSSEVEPDFWVPPVIGPWMIQSKMRSEAEKTSEGIEKLANQAP